MDQTRCRTRRRARCPAQGSGRSGSVARRARGMREVTVRTGGVAIQTVRRWRVRVVEGRGVVEVEFRPHRGTMAAKAVGRADVWRRVAVRACPGRAEYETGVTQRARPRRVLSAEHDRRWVGERVGDGSVRQMAWSAGGQPAVLRAMARQARLPTRAHEVVVRMAAGAREARMRSAGQREERGVVERVDDRSVAGVARRAPGEASMLGPVTAEARLPFDVRVPVARVTARAGQFRVRSSREVEFAGMAERRRLEPRGRVALGASGQPTVVRAVARHAGGRCAGESAPRVTLRALQLRVATGDPEEDAVVEGARRPAVRRVVAQAAVGQPTVVRAVTVHACARLRVRLRLRVADETRQLGVSAQE